MLLEVFDSARSLRSQFRSIIEAAALDASAAPPAATPARRALRFLSRLEQTWTAETTEAGIGRAVAGRSADVHVAGVRWNDRDVHLRASYVRHPMLVGAL